MFHIIYLAVAAVLLFLVLISEKNDNLKGVLAAKPVLSAMFIILALLQPRPEGLYFPLIITGLAFCMAGDIFLVFFFRKKIFMAGLAAFLAGHIFYFIAFLNLAGITGGTLIALICLAAVSGFIFMRLKSRLGTMLGPVVAYLVIISLMVAGAAGVFASDASGLPGRTAIMAAAVIFYCSDIFVARHRFVKKEMINRYFSLPLYYIAQFTLAFSIGLTAA